MPRVSQTNLEIILGDWLDALRRRDFEAITARLDPHVKWQGVRPELVCPNREAVLDLLPRLGLAEVEAIELIGRGDKVVLGVRTPELQEVAGVQLHGQVFNVITPSRRKDRPHPRLRTPRGGGEGRRSCRPGELALAIDSPRGKLTTRSLPPGAAARRE